MPWLQILQAHRKWVVPVFNYIVLAEQQYMSMIKVLLDKYTIKDPVQDDTAGVFADPEMQKLYEVLVEKGRKSVVDAPADGYDHRGSRH